MKSERRHELQHNDLAEWIVKSYERAAPYKNMILGVVILVAVLILGVSLWHSHSVSQNAEAWNSLGVPVFQPNLADEHTISELQQKTVQNYSGTIAAQWADVFIADTNLMIGTNKILTEKKVGLDYLTRAKEVYTKSLDNLTLPAAKEQAMFGKARAIESLIESKSDLEDAVAAYQDLNKSFPDGIYKALADQRIEQLQKKDALKFYLALAQYTPKPKAESPRSKLENLGPLPDNPSGEPVPSPPVRPQTGGAIPVPPLTPGEPGKMPTLKMDLPSATQPAGPGTTKLQPVQPDAPNSEAPKAEAPKKEVPKTAEPPKTQDAPKKDK
jgi:hypothetical protein